MIVWNEHGDPDAPALVLLHSLGTNGALWDGQADLADDYRLIVADIRGHGRSPVTPSPYHLDTLGEDVLAVVSEIDRFHVCGVSLGGQIALWMAIHHPHRLQTVTIANSAARVGTAQGWADRATAIGEQGMDDMAEPIVGRWFTEGFAQRQPETWERALAMFRATDPEGYVACCWALAETDLRPDVGRIETPALIIGGSDDVSTPPEDAEWLAANIRGSRVEIIDEAAHLSNVEQPTVFNRLLRDHLTG